MRRALALLPAMVACLFCTCAVLVFAALLSLSSDRPNVQACLRRTGWLISESLNTSSCFIQLLQVIEQVSPSSVSAALVMRLPQPSHQIPTKQLTHMCISPMPQLSNIEDDDDEDVVGAILGQNFPRTQPTPYRRYSRRPHRGANESLTNSDILGAKLTFTHLDSLLILLILTYPFPSASQVI
jgi:hypothetical protein